MDFLMRTLKKVVGKKKEIFIKKCEYYDIYKIERKYILKFFDDNIYKREIEILQDIRNDNIMKIISVEKDSRKIITYPFYEYEQTDYLLYNEYLCIRLANIMHFLHKENKIVFSNIGYESIFLKKNGFLLLANFMFFKNANGDFSKDDDDFKNFTETLLKKQYSITDLFDKTNLFIELENKIDRFNLLDLQEKYFFLNKLDFQKINFHMKNQFAKIFIAELTELKNSQEKKIRDKGQIERAIFEENLNNNYDYYAIIAYLILLMDLENLNAFFDLLISINNLPYREIFLREYNHFIRGDVNFNKKENFKELIKNIKEKNKMIRQTAYVFLNNIFYLLNEKNMKDCFEIFYNAINSERENIFHLINNNYIAIINGRAVKELYKIILLLLTDKKYFYHILVIIKEIYQFIPPYYIANDILPVISQSLIYFDDDAIFSILNKLVDYLKTYRKNISVKDFKSWNSLISK